MHHVPAYVLRVLALIGAVLSVVAADVSAAHAQSSSCQRLIETLDTLERNNDFRNALGAEENLRLLSRQVQRAESRYVREGCNDDAKAGRRLNGSCRALANEITSGREQVAALERSVGTGNAVAQQREAILQEIARFGCGGGRMIQDERSARGNLFDELFGVFGGDDGFDGGGGFREDDWWGYGGYHTVRTLCVRKSDGFYWPISYSTLPEYVSNDAEQCHAQCPGVDVDLYYHDNPGQEPEQAINMWGEPYVALPNAFKFRTEFDKANTCKQTTNYGSINLAENGAGGSRAMVEFNGMQFPLPMRDPRRPATATPPATVTVAEVITVPLPRRRPAAPGEEPKPVPVAAATTSEPMRIVQFGDKRVRVVGPDTPYAPRVAAGS